MAAVTVRLPTLLARLIDRGRTVQVEAATVSGAVEALLEEFPALRVHLFDESGGLRPHVRCFHNDTDIVWPDRSPVAEGDVVTVMQAVSGGG